MRCVVIVINRINQTYTRTSLSLRGAQRRGNLPEGKTDVAYTDFIPLPLGISPMRSDYRPHSGRNDIIKQADKKLSPLGKGGTSASEANRVANEGNRTL